MLDLYLKGGVLMHPILFASIVALAIALERGWFFWRIRRIAGKSFEAMSERLLKGDRPGAVAAAEKITGPIGVVLREGLRHHEEGAEIAQEAMAIRGEEILRSAQKGIPALALIASISTMAGLLGTVVGLVEAFQKVAEMEERVSPALLASGIWAALITTVAGLVVAIPTLIAYHYFQGKLSHLSFQIEHYGSEMILSLKKGARIRIDKIRLEEKKPQLASISIPTEKGGDRSHPAIEGIRDDYLARLREKIEAARRYPDRARRMGQGEEWRSDRAGRSDGGNHSIGLPVGVIGEAFSICDGDVDRPKRAV